MRRPLYSKFQYPMYKLSTSLLLQTDRAAFGSRAYARALPLLRTLASLPRAPSYEQYLAALRLVCRPGGCPAGRLVDECGELLFLLRALVAHTNRDVRREAEAGASRLMCTVREGSPKGNRGKGTCNVGNAFVIMWWKPIELTNAHESRLASRSNKLTRLVGACETAAFGGTPCT